MIAKSERTGEAPETVEVVGRHVWLRKNVEAVEREVDLGGFDSVVETAYVYDEVHYEESGTPDTEQVRASFDELWAAHASDGVPDAERIDGLVKQLEKTKAAIDDANSALLELGDLIGGEE